MKKEISLSFLCMCLPSSISFAVREFPEELLPAHISVLTDFGERPDWSLDGTKIAFLDSMRGDVYEIDIATREIRQIFKAPAGMGCYRVLYLSNGDFFITYGRRRWDPFVYILDSGLTKEPTIIEVPIQEGPAISRKSLHLAYCSSNMQDISEADIVYDDQGIPSFQNIRILFRNSDVPLAGGGTYSGQMEPQNFRPPEDKDLTFNVYSYNGSDAMLYNGTTKTFFNFTDNPCYQEAEGIFPDGQYTLVEGTRHNCRDGSAHDDIYRYSLTDPNDWERLTFLSDVDGFKANQPVVRDDGLVFVFQEGRSSAEAGVGCAMYLFDMVAYGLVNVPASNSQIRPEIPGAWSKQILFGDQILKIGRYYDVNGRFADQIFKEQNLKPAKVIITSY